MEKKYRDGKRYYSFDQAMKEKFGGKIARIPLDAGFTCPNRDGSKGTGGCTFCSGAGSGEFTAAGAEISQQFETMRAIVQRKWQPIGYLAYFQAFSNTYAPLPRLRQLYEQAIAFQDVVGLCIATRADCITEEIADYLQQLSQKTYLSVELGLQSVHNETARRIHRGHTLEEFQQGLTLLTARSVPVGVHLINGLPGETKQQMLASAAMVAQWPIASIKIHLLHVLRDTKLAEEYEQKEFPLLSQEEYVELVCDQLELLPETMIVSRLTGDGKGSELIGPMWSRNKRSVLNAIDRELLLRDSFQGKKHCLMKPILI